MDVVLPEGPSEGVSGDNEGDGTAAETRDNLGIQQTQEGRESEVQESREHGESDELKPGSERTASHQGRGKQASSRKPRARTKGLVKKLQEQIEFYFGDANLPKDKFLQQKIKEHPERYVSVDVIASFKKMEALTSDRALILKAIQNSSIVELSEDRQWLRRVSPLPSISNADVDSRTIYVENLSTQSTDHDSIRNMFKVFGSITYVSLPKHKVSGEIKGFAFIEYSTPEEAKTALEYFTSKEKEPQSRKPSVVQKKKGSDPDGGRKTPIGAETEEPEVELAESAFVGRADSEIVEHTEVTMEEGEELTGRGEKRGREEEEGEGKGDGEEDGQPSAKRLKSDSKERDPESSESRQEVVEQRPSHAVTSRKESCAETGENELSVSESSLLKPSRLDSQSSEVERDGVLGEEKGETKKKKNRQHKKKQWTTILRDLNLRVMSKTDWLEMKRMYRDLQKEHMKRFKSEMGSRSVEEDGGPAKNQRGFVANCLLKVTCSSERGADVTELERFCSKFGKVAYMDIKAEDKEGYIRFRESGCVEALLKSEQLPEDVVLSGVEEEDERAYYLKSQAQRKQKFLKRRQNARGRDKLISKVLRTHEVAAESSKKTVEKEKDSSREPTHIRFSDSDSETNMT